MFKRLKEPFGKAGLIVALVALVFAMVGGAYAATGGSGNSNATASAKKHKKKKSKKPQRGKQGKPGKNGAPGAPGAAGPTGPAGAQGPKGDTGAQGPEGPEGPEGEPWAAGGTLPPEATLTGTYATSLTNDFLPEGETKEDSVSFGIQVSPAPTFVFVPGVGGTTSYGSDAANGCPGVVGGIPRAESGKFCVYGFAHSVFVSATVEARDPGAFPPGHAVTPNGATLVGTCPTGNCMGNGLWAVTG